MLSAKSGRASSMGRANISHSEMILTFLQSKKVIRPATYSTLSEACVLP
jgi:hypothetical protein